MALALAYRTMMIEGLSLRLNQEIMKGGHSMPNKNAELVASEKKAPIKDEVREQLLLYTKECIWLVKKPLAHLAESFIDRVISFVIDALG